MAKSRHLVAANAPGEDLFLRELKCQDHLLYQHMERRRWTVKDWERHLIKTQGKNGWYALPIAIQNCVAYFKLSSNAKVVLSRCFCESKAPRNAKGKVQKFNSTKGYSEFFLPYNLIQAIGIRNDGTISRTLKQLIKAGFIERVGESRRGVLSRFKLSDNYK